MLYECEVMKHDVDDTKSRFDHKQPIVLEIVKNHTNVTLCSSDETQSLCTDQGNDFRHGVGDCFIQQVL